MRSTWRSPCRTAPSETRVVSYRPAPMKTSGEAIVGELEPRLRAPGRALVRRAGRRLPRALDLLERARDRGGDRRIVRLGADLELAHSAGYSYAAAASSIIPKSRQTGISSESTPRFVR